MGTRARPKPCLKLPMRQSDACGAGVVQRSGKEPLRHRDWGSKGFSDGVVHPRRGGAGQELGVLRCPCDRYEVIGAARNRLRSLMLPWHPCINPRCEGGAGRGWRNKVVAAVGSCYRFPNGAAVTSPGSRALSTRPGAQTGATEILLSSSPANPTIVPAESGTGECQPRGRGA